MLEDFDLEDHLQVISAAKLEHAGLVIEEGLFQNMGNYDNEILRTNSKAVDIIHFNSKNLCAAGIRLFHSVYQALRG